MYTLCRVSLSGYRIIEADTITDGEVQRAKVLILASQSTKFRHYDPLELQNPYIYYKLAKMPKTEEAVLEFANAYGFLGFSRPGAVLLAIGNEGKYAPAYGEYLNDWYKEINDLYRAVELCEHLRLVRLKRKEGLKKLEELIHWKSNDSVVYDWPEPITSHQEIIAEGKPGHHEVIADSKIPEHQIILEHCQPPGVILPAQWLLQRWVNKKLGQYVSPRLLWDRGYKILEYHEHAANLIGSLWYHLARDIPDLKYKDVESCLYCGEPFTRSWNQQKYCNNKCRQNDYNRRKRNQAKVKEEQSE